MLSTSQLTSATTRGAADERGGSVNGAWLRQVLFATFLNVVFLKGVLDILRAKQAQWGQSDADPGALAEESPATEGEENP